MAGIYALGSVVLISLISLVGVFTLSIGDRLLGRIVMALVAMSVGALLGDAFLHLLPESFAAAPGSVAPSLYVLAGILGFFVMEKFLRWRHQHTLEACCPIHPVGHMNLVGDALHNFVDGVLVAAGFLAGIPVGVATAVAVALHEIPQEICDFGILLHAGYGRKRALLLNLLSGATAVVGAAAALVVGSGLEGFTAAVLPLTAGGFIYIAGSDLVPDLHKVHAPGDSALQLAAMAAGVALMILLLFLG